MAEDIELELAAMKALIETLEPLKPEVRARVIDYVFKVLGIEPSQAPAPTSSSPAPSWQPASTETVLPKTAGGPKDILSFKEEKSPTTGTQMIAVVAYYLAHLAAERQDFITGDDIRKYFVQAKYPMPASLSQALVNAKNAGYLDFVEAGKYRLNSVGYNLVAHRMPRDSTPSGAPKRKKKSAKKSRK